MAAIGVDSKILKTLNPFNRLTPASLAELSAKSKIEQIEARHFVFKQDARDNYHTYLLSGEVELILDGQIIGKVVAGSPAAANSIDPKQPHQVTCRALEPVKVLRVDANLLEILLDSGESSSIIADEAETGIDWMARLFASPLFHWIPAANLQQILMKMESVPVSKRQTIIQQGSEGQYFYAVQEGLCSVQRTVQGAAFEVAKLQPGHTFGEASLLSTLPCNATVVALQDGSVMRLTKANFDALIKNPIMRWYDTAQCAALIKEGAIWLDVRSIEEYQKGHLPNSKHVPLFDLYQSVRQLDSNHQYIVYSQEERRSAVGVFLLLQHGIDAVGLREGVSAFKNKAPKTKPQAPMQAPLLDVPLLADEPVATPAVAIKEQPPVSKQIAAEHASKLLAQAKAERERVKQEAERLIKLAQEQAKEEAIRIQREADQRVQAQEEAARHSFEAAYRDLQEEFHELNQELFLANENLHKTNQVLQGYRKLAEDKQKIIQLLQQVSVKITDAAQLQHLEWAKAEQCRDEVLILLEQSATQLQQQASTQKYQDLQQELLWLVEVVHAIQNIAVPGSVE